jgi:capsular polysaccharide biosynthesis protein
LANDFLAARYDNDHHLVAKYHQLILSKVIADKVDITSNGQSIAPIIEMTTQELPDYSQIIDIDVKPS